MTHKMILVLGFVLCTGIATISAQLTISPAVIEGQVGEDVMFNCTSTDPGVGSIIDLEVQTAEGTFTVFETTPLATDRFFRNSSGSVANFTFGPLRSNDNRLVFRCTLPGVTSQTAMISVTFGVMITGVMPDNRTITLVENSGEVFNLTLTVEGNPPPTYTWTRDGAAVMNRSTLTVSQNSFLAYVVRENMGFYEVVYDNTIGTANHDFTLNIQYQSEFPANAVENSPDTVCREMSGVFVCTARTGSSVTLVCNAMGNPSPMVAVTPADAPRSGNNIVFSVVALSDTGNYTCTASSSGFNDVERRFQLIVGGPPGSASELTTTISLNEGSITFTWTYPDSLNEVPITGFVITITQDIGGEDVIIMELPPDQLSFTLPLSQFMTQMSYTASVIVRSTQGSSAPIFDPFTIPDSSASNIVASHILSLLIIAIIVCYSFV